eukprot:1161863-Pelagomonas_calceolata.AAC.8
MGVNSLNYPVILDCAINVTHCDDCCAATGAAGAGVLRQGVLAGGPRPGCLHGSQRPQLPCHSGLRDRRCTRDAALALQQRAAHGPEGAQRHAGQLRHGGQGRELQGAWLGLFAIQTSMPV